MPKQRKEHFNRIRRFRSNEVQSKHRRIVCLFIWKCGVWTNKRERVSIPTFIQLIVTPDVCVHKGPTYILNLHMPMVECALKSHTHTLIPYECVRSYACFVSTQQHSWPSAIVFARIEKKTESEYNHITHLWHPMLKV